MEGENGQMWRRMIRCRFIYLDDIWERKFSNFLHPFPLQKKTRGSTRTSHAVIITQSLLYKPSYKIRILEMSRSSLVSINERRDGTMRLINGIASLVPAKVLWLSILSSFILIIVPISLLEVSPQYYIKPYHY